MLKRFNLLCEEIKNQIISVDTFEFKFNKDEDTDKVTCKFTILNEKQELCAVICTINSNNTKTFKIYDKENKNSKEIDEKQFMIKYYKDYDKFKNALSKWKEESEKEEAEENEEENNVSDSEIINSKTPQVTSFSSKLKNNDLKNKGLDISIENITFTFRDISDKVKNLTQANFELLNELPKEDEYQKYNVVALIKLLKENSVPVKFILTPVSFTEEDEENTAEQEELTGVDFKEKFPKYYSLLIQAINSYENSKN